MDAIEIIIDNLSKRGLLDATKADKETVFKSLVESGVVVLTNEQKKQYEENIKNETYKNAQAIGYKNGLRDVLKEYDTELTDEEIKGKRFEDLRDMLKTAAEKKSQSKTQEKVKELEGQIEKNTEAKLKEFEKQFSESSNSVKKLQSLLQEKDNLLKEIEIKRIQDKADMLAMNEISKVNINVPTEIETQGDKAINEYINKQKELLFVLYNNKYKHTINENGQLIVTDSTGKTIKDSIENPLPINSILNNIVTNYSLSVTKEEKKGRGAMPLSSNLGELAKCKTFQDVVVYMEKNNITPSTAQGDAIIKEWKKIKL